jgi:hypothetical protein
MSKENPIFQVEGIISITGKSEVFRMVARSRNGLIAEKLDKTKKFPVSATQGVSALSEIAIYSYNEEVPLKEVMGQLFAHLNGAEAPVKTADEQELRSLFEVAMPEYDKNRVYLSDIKKVMNWYNQLIAAGHGLVSETASNEEVVEAAAAAAADDSPKEGQD